MKTHKLTLNSLVGFEVEADEGEVMRVPLGTNIQQANVANVTIRVEGSADVYYGDETEPGKTLSAGSTSLEGDWARIARYEQFRLKVVTPKYRYYCLRDVQNRQLNPVAVRSPADTTVALPANKNLFVAIGTVAIGDVVISAPAQFFTGQQETNVSVVTDTLMVQFDKPE